MENTRVENSLLIDDDEIDLTVNRTVLQLSGFSRNIISTQKAEDALEYLKDSSEKLHEIPDVIFLDIRMPGMNGFEFLDEFEKLPEEVVSKTKIYVLSSSLDEEDRTRALRNKNVIDYLCKPLTRQMISTLQ